MMFVILETRYYRHLHISSIYHHLSSFCFAVVCFRYILHCHDYKLKLAKE